MSVKALLLRGLGWLLRLFAAPAAAQAEGEAAARARAAEAAALHQKRVHDAQNEIAMRPAAGRDALLDRMRRGEL